MANRVKIGAWADQAAKRTHEIIIDEGLSVFYRGWIQGPMTVSLIYQLKKPTIRDLNKFKKLGPAISLIVGVSPIRIAQEGQALHVEIPLPVKALRTPTAGELAEYGEKFDIPAGIDTQRRPVLIDFARYPVTLLVGPPGRGKSEAIRSILAIIAARVPVDRAQFYIASRKSAEYREFEPMTAVREIAKNSKDARKLLDYIANVLLEERGNNGTKWPALFICIDDYPGLLADDPEIATAVEKISTEGRALQLILIIGTHAAGNKRGMGKGLADSNAAARIVYKATSGGATSRSAGVKASESGADQLTGNHGDAIIILNGDARRIATAHRSEQVTRFAPTDPIELEPEEEARHELHHPAPVVDAAPPLHHSAPAYTTPRHPTPGGVAHIDPATVGPETQNQHIPTGAPESGAGGAALPALPRIEEKRKPTPAEAEQIAAHIRARRNAGESTSQRYLITNVYGGTRERDRIGWLKEIMQTAEHGPDPSALYDDGGAMATDEPTSTLTEADIFRIQAEKGMIDWSTISAGD